MENCDELCIVGESITNKNNDDNGSIESEISKTELSKNDGKSKLLSWSDGYLKIKMTDGRVLVGNLFCTDRDSNVILGSSQEYLKEEDVGVKLPRTLGLVMVPGRHIVSVHYRKIG